jgi:hypothetical protein
VRYRTGPTGAGTAPDARRAPLTAVIGVRSDPEPWTTAPVPADHRERPRTDADLDQEHP